ncbi:signal peptide peptidase [Actinidia rufa]|uniref:Signal peptide peptidase n=1 Tax=Actinidia rufa TaxID=165716 RepID=A0A7J0GA36_9ERIC|nr:signal peptide peptidase [Actinidia rufa]
MSELKERLGLQKDKNLPTVDYRKYSRVRKWTLGLSGGKDQIAVIRATGSISRVRGPFSVSSSGIIAEQFIEKIRSVRARRRPWRDCLPPPSHHPWPIGAPARPVEGHRAKRKPFEVKSTLIGVESSLVRSGRVSDEIGASFRQASEKEAPIRGSQGDSPPLCKIPATKEEKGLRGIQGRERQRSLARPLLINALSPVNAEILFSESKRYKAVIIRIDSPGGDALASDLPDEAELFAKSAQNVYRQFRDKAAFSRSMTVRVDKMEEVAQGRVWTAKQKASIPQDRQVTLVELSRPSPSLPEILSGIGSSLVGVDTTLKELLGDLISSEGIQARMDGIMFQKLEGSSYGNPFLNLIKDYLSSL